MKRITFITCLLFAGCASQLTHIPAETETLGFDFRPYSAKGFLITPGTYQGDYDAIGMVTFIMWPEMNYSKAQRRQNTFNTDGQPSTAGYWERDVIVPDTAISNAYRQALSMGADALAHFEIRPVTKTVEHVVVLGMEVSGYAIKRK